VVSAEHAKLSAMVLDLGDLEEENKVAENVKDDLKRKGNYH